MKINQLSILICILTIVFASEDKSVQEILLNTFHRLDSINHQFLVKFNESDKKTKTKSYQISINWPLDGEVLKETRVLPINKIKNKPSSFWEHQFKDKRKIKRWMSMPISGKLKDVSDKKSSKQFSLADLEFNEKDIFENSNDLIGTELIDGQLRYVINSIKKSKEGKNKDFRKIWIGTDDYIIYKVEFYTKSGRLYRTVECKSIFLLDGIHFPSEVYVKDRKSKSEIIVELFDFIIDPEFSNDIFKPKSQ